MEATCSSCGAELQPDWIACPKCGEQLRPAAPAEQKPGEQLDSYFQGQGRPSGKAEESSDLSSIWGKETVSKRDAQKTPAAQPASSPPRKPSAVGQVVRGTGRMISANPGHFFQTLFSVRWGCSAMLLALIPAVIGSLITPVLGTVLFFVVFVPVWIIGAANPGNVLYCPYCRKRVKVGATTCHHCGRSVAGA